MLIKKETEYAMLGLIELSKSGENFRDAKVLAKDRSISESLMAKIFQRLANAGILESRLGPNGGFRLSRDPSEINLFEVVRAVQPANIIKCTDGRAAYCPKETCLFRATVGKMEKFIDEFLTNTTLTEIIN
ncbi:MAG: Rrf2 family transcriptional regulator [bacterium]|nr:Rrf2 family transcriptional regulator [bacterium]